MKTIRNLSTDTWKRVSDAEAASTVGRKGWEYCPKSEWKTKVRDYGKAPKEKKAKKEENAVPEQS
jgi:hypothetical protein